MGEVFSSLSWVQLLTLILALGLALGFECVNGFHDTANAVATVIYTRSFPPWLAVVWSGAWNLIGVITSSGAVAFAIVNLLPVDLVTNICSPVGFSMIFSLLLSALVWNVGTWYRGLPVSSTHSMIGSIMGVGLMNSLLATGNLIGGVNWQEARNVGLSLILSPVIGFIGAALLLWVLKALVRKPELYIPADSQKTPPFWIRGILGLTCTGVSFAHGSNDGQKGLGLLMLILAGLVPGIYAVNPATQADSLARLTALSQSAGAALQKRVPSHPLDQSEATKTLVAYLESDSAFTEKVFAALARKNQEIADTLARHKSLSELHKNERIELRSRMYLTTETIGKLAKAKKISAPEAGLLLQYKGALDQTTKFIPFWVKAAVALALGVGTMIGWKRIVVTIGERIGKTHLTYAQGASAELVAMSTIGLASQYGLPVSTTHVLSSGVAGTMAANRSGLQKATLRNIILAWVLTLPACVYLGAMFFGAALLLVLRVFGLH